MEPFAEIIAAIRREEPDRYDVLDARQFLFAFAKVLVDEELIEVIARRIHDAQCKVPWENHGHSVHNIFLGQAMDTLDALRDEILEQNDRGGIRGEGEEEGNKGS